MPLWQREEVQEVLRRMNAPTAKRGQLINEQFVNNVLPNTT
jgi:hypothetical protein